jgi:uncharacterized protein YbcC (UPF0753/DUF2309 family)
MARLNNIHVYLHRIGDVELKGFFSLGDLQDVSDLLSLNKDDKLVVLKILYSQLVKPKLSFEDFEKLSDEQIQKLAITFSENNKNIFENFKETTDDEFYQNFRTALEIYFNKFSNKYMQQFEAITQIGKVYKDFYEQYSNAIQNQSYINNSLRDMGSNIEKYIIKWESL